MLKAQQNQLAQAANNDIVSIRSNEVNYFVQFFTNFGTQCALIAGFQLSSISQVPTWDATNDIAYVYIYWISSSICICLSVHVLLCSVYASVFGQGLALRGPAGSMVRAVDGMIQEQRQILVTFSLNIFFLGVSTMATYYVVMSLLAAHICTGITFVAMIYWYRYCLRIYNRFKWVDAPTKWLESDSQDPRAIIASMRDGKPRQNSLDGRRKRSKPSFFARVILGKKSKERTGSHSSERRPGSTTAVVDHGQRDTVVIGGEASIHSSKSANDLQRVHSYGYRRESYEAEGGVSVRSGAGYGFNNVSYQGYISRVEHGYIRNNVQRVYMLLVHNKLVWFENKRAYENEPEKPMNKRPLYLDNYVISSDRVNGVFEIHLIPDSKVSEVKKDFHFRVDTAEEMQGWLGAFKAVIRSRSVASASSRTPLLRSSVPIIPPTGGGEDDGYSVRQISRDSEADAYSVTSTATSNKHEETKPLLIR